MLNRPFSFVFESPRSATPRLAAVFVAALIAGCGGPANGRLGISGTVTFDGAPLEQGAITFVDAEGKLPSSGAMIVAGKFLIPDGKGLRPGHYKVAVDSADENGAVGNAGPYTMAIPISKIPSRYSTETTLAAEVLAEGDNHFTFELSSK